MWVPVPQDWNKACQLIPGLPAQKPWSSLLPGLVCVTEAYPELPFRVPQELGKAERLLGDWCPEQDCQAKLGTEEAQLQAWSGELGVGRTAGEGLLSTHSPLPPTGFSPARVSEQQCSTLGF